MILVLAAIGFCIALYAYFVENKMKADASYHPACDINDRISCSKPLQSQYSNLFFISNSLAAMLYYVVIALLAFMGMHTVLVIATTLGLIVSLGLAYLLYFKIKSLCLVCTSLYIINILLFVATIL